MAVIEVRTFDVIDHTDFRSSEQLGFEVVAGTYVCRWLSELDGTTSKHPGNGAVRSTRGRRVPPPDRPNPSRRTTH